MPITTKPHTYLDRLTSVATLEPPPPFHAKIEQTSDDAQDFRQLLLGSVYRLRFLLSETMRARRRVARILVRYRRLGATATLRQPRGKPRRGRVQVLLVSQESFARVYVCLRRTSQSAYVCECGCAYMKLRELRLIGSRHSRIDVPFFLE